MAGGDYDALEARIGYWFADRELLIRALTHRSLAAEVPPGAPAADHNEKLEFLGDAVLGFLASDHLYRLYPKETEGSLSRLKALLVSASRLYQLGLEIDIGSHLRLGRGEDLSGGRAKKALLANAVEALIAAIYLDGGVEACRAFLQTRLWNALPAGEPGQPPTPQDAKSALQELAQARKLPVPRYVIVRESGPEHAKTFTVEARVGKEFAAQADGHSKKAAGLKAAAALLARLAGYEENSSQP
jgi:ribonuclease III